MRLLLACAVISLAACGGRFQTRTAGGAAFEVKTATGERALEERGRVIEYLVAQGAAPGQHEQRAAAERTAREHRLVAGAELAARIEADAQYARARLRTYLMGLGAHARPPKPPPRPEVPGDAPFEGAAWIAGGWRWEDAAWIWFDGAWSDPVSFGLGSGGGAAAERGPRGARGEVGVFGDRVAIIRDHRDSKRGDDGFSPAPVIRDHRDGKRGDGGASPAPVIRDHRDGKRDERPAPTVRDHRDGKRGDSRDSKQKDDDDRPARVRDHRR